MNELPKKYPTLHYLDMEQVRISLCKLIDAVDELQGYEQKRQDLQNDFLGRMQEDWEDGSEPRYTVKELRGLWRNPDAPIGMLKFLLWLEEQE